MMGLSRDTFYRDKSATEEGGVDTLFDSNRRQPNLKNRIDPAVESVVKYAVEEPAHGQTRTSNERRKRGTFVSLSGIRGILVTPSLGVLQRPSQGAGRLGGSRGPYSHRVSGGGDGTQTTRRCGRKRD